MSQNSAKLTFKIKKDHEISWDTHLGFQNEILSSEMQNLLELSQVANVSSVIDIL